MGGALVSVGAATIGSVGMASAATSSSSNQQSIVDKIASKFNLKREDVQKVFDDERASHEAQREQDMKTRLNQAVKDGKISQEQEDKLIAKLKELKDSRPDKGPGEASDAEREAHRKVMDDFKQWLTDNKIPEDLVRPMGGRGHGPMGGHGHGGEM